MTLEIHVSGKSYRTEVEGGEKELREYLAELKENVENVEAVYIIFQSKMNGK